MLTSISVLTCLLFSVLYPLCFWSVRGHPIDDGFRKFNLFLVNLAGAVVLFSILKPEFSLIFKIAVLVWAGSFFLVSALAWQRKNISNVFLSLPSVAGLPLAYLTQGIFVPGGTPFAPVVLGGIILCLSIFSLTLGHWYLNVSGLPISYLARVNNIFWIFLGVRVLVDVFLLITQKILHSGDVISLYQFLFRTDGILLFVPLFFGTLLPAFLLYFVSETLKVKSTQSATGILYVVAISVLMGDLAYKYFLIKFGIAL